MMKACCVVMSHRIDHVLLNTIGTPTVATLAPSRQASAKNTRPCSSHGWGTAS